MNAEVGFSSDSVEVVGDKAGIFKLADWAEGWASAQGASSDAVFAVRLCVEEAVTNIVHYAFDAEPGPGIIKLNGTTLANSIQLTVADAGRPFDVCAAEDSGRETDIHSATIGGRGIRLMRRFSNSLHYARVGDENRLTMTFSMNKPGPDR